MRTEGYLGACGRETVLAHFGGRAGLQARVTEKALTTHSYTLDLLDRKVPASAAFSYYLVILFFEYAPLAAAARKLVPDFFVQTVAVERYLHS